MNDLKTLLKSVNFLLEHQREIEFIKGEKFNIFSILKMETRENSTHSAFIGELLNPIGTHNCGHVFLKIFNQVIQKNISEKKHLDLNTSFVQLEKSIGKRNDSTKKGGRVDLFIKDKFGNTICIENKIYAIDQNSQIERYCNYNKNRNTVYYLTLFGEEPSISSKGKLESGIDFYNISYKNEIIEWLKLCVKEAVNLPILRETLKQYIVLIKKITNEMNIEEETKLKKLLFNNLEGVQTIVNNYSHFLRKAKSNFINACKLSIQNKIDTDIFELHFNEKNKIWQMWIYLKEFRNAESKIWFGIEPFSGFGPHLNNEMFIGIINFDFEKNKFNYSGNSIKLNDGWVAYKKIKYKEDPINLSNNHFLKMIHDSNSNDFKDLVDVITETSVKFIEDNKKYIIDYYESIK